MADNPTATTETTGLNEAVKDALDSAPTTHAHLLSWVREMAELTQPDRIHWVDGSEAEWTQLTDELVDAGTFVRLDEEKFPNSFAAFSDPNAERRTAECTPSAPTTRSASSTVPSSSTAPAPPGRCRTPTTRRP